METRFNRVHTAKDLTISIVTIIAGAALFFVNKGLGSLLVTCGILLLLFWKSGYRKQGDKIILTKKALDLCKSCRGSILEYLSGKDVDPIIKEGNEGGVVRIETYFNRQAGVAYAQLIDYVGYEYMPATDVVELRSPEAEKLISQL